MDAVVADNHTLIHVPLKTGNMHTHYHFIPFLSFAGTLLHMANVPRDLILLSHDMSVIFYPSMDVLE